MKRFKLSVAALTLTGLIFIVIGMYFIFLRPPFLPGDSRYIGTTLAAINDAIPGLSGWITKVFWVMGGYILTTGLLFAYVANTSFQKQMKGVFSLVTIAGILSIGLMTIVNFIIDSDFKWTLLASTLPWIIALILYKFNK